MVVQHFHKTIKFQLVSVSFIVQNPKVLSNNILGNFFFKLNC